ncbi:hypothetical protein ABTX82_32590 [Streptomyces lavendulae]|uniref:Mu transposase domain-containing protein n=1 Tax=Streptomyces lavendulae TaxID=1914 RepID=UPI0033331E2E
MPGGNPLECPSSAARTPRHQAVPGPDLSQSDELPVQGEVPDGLSVEQAQAGVDKLALRMNERRRLIEGASVTAADLAAAEALLDVPTRPFPAEPEVERTVSPQGLVCFDGSPYSVPPGLPGAQVKVLHRLGEDYLHIPTVGRAVVAKHRRAPSGSG